MYKISIIILAISGLCLQACKENDPVKASTFKFIKPAYNGIQIKLAPDTLNILLNENTFNAVKSVNIFSENGREYLAFFDLRSESLNVYTLMPLQLVKKIQIQNWFQRSLYKTTVFVKNFDSIFITNQNRLYLCNSVGNVKKSIYFLGKPESCFAFFDNNNPPILIKNILFAGVRPYVKEKSLNALKEWKVLYLFDLHNKKAGLRYPLPKQYQQHLYGYHFLNYSYCYNNHNRFVFSFPADTNIYETNLAEFHNAYLAKSQYQHAPIEPVTKEELATSDKQVESFITRDSYGPIYFDPARNRYLRVARSKISLADYKAKKYNRGQRLLVFDENFKIVGESEIDNHISLNTLFITKEGAIYAQTNSNDEYALHFVRLVYSDDPINSPNQLVQK